MSGSLGVQKAKSNSNQVNYGSNVWEPQAPYLQDMYGQAQGVMNRQMGNVYTPGQTRQVLNPAYQGNQGQGIAGPTMPLYAGDGYGGPSSQPIYGQNSGYAQNNEPQYITQTDPGSWNYSGQDSPEVAQAKALMQQMGGQYGQATSALNNAGQYTGQAYEQIGSANPNWGQAEGALGTATGYYDQANQGVGMGYGALNSAQQGFQGIANAANGVDPMSDVYKRLTGQQFNEVIMPGIGGEAAMAGGVGSSRQGIAQGLAAARSGQQLQDWNAQLYAGQQERALAANQGLSGVGSAYGGLAGIQGQLGQGMTNVGQGYTNIGNARVGQGVATGNLGALQAQLANGYQNNAKGLAGMAEMGMNLPWYALQQYAGLLGSPTMRSLGGTGESKSNSFGINMSGGVI